MKALWLTPAQREIVHRGDEPLLVVAGPGSGKTRVLTERIRRLLALPGQHFRVLAVTFTNKAANEMRERLDHLGENQSRLFLGTLHQFCLDLLSDRGQRIGITGPFILFESFQDRKRILSEAAQQDAYLRELLQGSNPQERDQQLGYWLNRISLFKANPVSLWQQKSSDDQAICEAYDGGLRACNAYDFDDILLLAYELLSQHPRIASLYRNVYRYLCIDEAQDLNEAQYSVIQALCGDDSSGVLMVGDPKQSIYGFSTASPEYMDRFAREFSAIRIELKENFRSARSIVRLAQSLVPEYRVESQLPMEGQVVLIQAEDEEEEARLICDKLEQLMAAGHPEIEGAMLYRRCSILGRSQFALLAVEKALRSRSIPYFKRLSSVHRHESPFIEDFFLGLRLLVNPQDTLHRQQLFERWQGKPLLSPAGDWFSELAQCAAQAQRQVVVEAWRDLDSQGSPPQLELALQRFEQFAVGLEEEERRALQEDVQVLAAEWDTYLRSRPGGTGSLAGFLSQMALGTTQQPKADAVALLTVHSSKGLEFDVVFVVGMVEGGFPDYRARQDWELKEEARNAFVAVTRSKRLLYLSHFDWRRTSWGEPQRQRPSRFLRAAGLLES